MLAKCSRCGIEQWVATKNFLPYGWSVIRVGAHAEEIICDDCNKYEKEEYRRPSDLDEWEFME